MKNRKDDSLIKKLLDNMKLNKNSDEIKYLQKIKKKVKEIKSIEELEALENELDAIGVLDREKLDRLKKKKKKQLEKQNQSFEERIRCDMETINRIIAIQKAYVRKEKIRKEEELIQAREERKRNGGEKEKEKDKKKEERLRTGRGRSREL